VSTPVLFLLAGPNGAGKSTFAEHILIPRTHLPFVNADVIAAHRWPGDRERQSQAALEVSRLAADARAQLMTTRTSFITETVFSHPSKLTLVQQARALGYNVFLEVVLIPEGTAVQRVIDRMHMGGHVVPEAKIRERYERLWSLVAQARDAVDRAQFYDNSSLDAPFRRVAVYEYGQVVGDPVWPTWTPSVLR
jgi:predicted ABC-type ATPase